MRVVSQKILFHCILQLYEDALELQHYFVQTRDDLCKNGERLLTPALSYTDNQLRKAIEKEKKEKLSQEQREDEEKKQAAETAEVGWVLTCMAFSVSQTMCGDFVGACFQSSIRVHA